MGNAPPFQRDVNTVFQSYALFPHKTVAQNIAFGLQMKKRPKTEIVDQVTQFLEMVRLQGYGGRKPNALSGGQKQRVALARALVNRPSILLLDEPLAALDLKLRKQMQSELKALQREVGITFVYVTHDQGEALALSDRIAVMDGGKVLQVGAPAEIYDYPKSRFVADFIGVSNFFVGKLVRLKGEWAEVKADFDSRMRLLGRHNGDLNEGESVMVAIRPERITLATTPTNGAPNQVSGWVQEEMYLGTTIQYTVLTSEEIPVLVHQQNMGAAGAGRIKRGDTVYLQWLPENATVLRG
jgi:spermidine/putrescine transport system ATP-binding protein